MQIELVRCTVQLDQKGNRNLTTIVKSGPDAVTVPELVLLYQQHSLDLSEAGCAIADAAVVGTIETTKDEELQRLVRKGFPIALIERNFPGGRMMPTTLAMADLPATAFGKPDLPAVTSEPGGVNVRDPDFADLPITRTDNSPHTVAARKKALRDALTAKGVTLPPGNLSEADLQALAEENGVTVLETV